MLTVPIHSFIVTQRDTNNPYAKSLLADALTLGFTDLTHIECSDCYFIQGQLTESEKQLLAAKLFCDPVAQIGLWQMTEIANNKGQIIETALRPGVTDPVADQILHGAQLLGIKNIKHTATGQRFVLHSTRQFIVAALA